MKNYSDSVKYSQKREFISDLKKYTSIINENKK